jgi:hypothetical protein
VHIIDVPSRDEISLFIQLGRLRYPAGYSLTIAGQCAENGTVV